MTRTQLPNPKNRVQLSKELFDALGLPRPQISYKISEYEQTGLKQARDFHDFVFEKVGVNETSHHKDFFGEGHIMGTYIMGKSRVSSVVDSDCKAHDHPNLYLLGSGVFPTVGTANPTQTISALSLRTANVINERLNL